MKVAELVCEIVRAKRTYYKGRQHLSDAAYDRLEDCLRELDPRHPVLSLVGWDDDYEWWLEHYKENGQ
jgi:DNA ligase (NAD+)